MGSIPVCKANHLPLTYNCELLTTPSLYSNGACYGDRIIYPELACESGPHYPA